MEGSFLHNLRPVWVARWQEIAPRLRFWLLLAGYDVRDRSYVDLFYVPYLVAFWLVWAFAMFAALSGVVAELLKAINPDMPASTAVQLLMWALLVWALVTLWRATRRSPLVFSAADAALLCQAPVDRRAVALIWFLSDWPRPLLPFAAAALALGFGLFEVNHRVESIDPAIVLGYSSYGLRAAGIVLPLHFLLLALSWTFGAWRLHGRQTRPLLRWLPFVVALLLAPVLFSGRQRAPGLDVWQAVTRPLQASFGLSSWLPPFLVAVALALTALALLLYTARTLNLSRAAQETSHLHSECYLTQVGAREAAARLRHVRRLGAESQVSRLPVRAGSWAIVWKDLARSRRGWQELFWPWLGVLGLSIGFLVAPDWSSRLVAAVFWVQLVANRATATLRNNLTHWWLWRQQPFPARQLVASSLAPPVAMLVLLSLSAWVIGNQLPRALDLSFAPLLPALAVLVTLVAAWDLLARIQSASLLAGEAPRVSALGLFLALLLVSTLLGIVWLVTRFTGMWSLGILVTLLLSLLLLFLLARQVADRASRFR